MPRPFLALTLALALPAALFAAEPARPGGVAGGARFDERARVWVLQSADRQVVWFESGVKKAEGGFSGNQRVGQWAFFHPGGQRKAEGSYRANLRHGRWRLYDDAGKLRSEGDYQNNRREGEWVFYYASGKVESRGSYQNDRKHGSWQNFYENGQLFYRGEYRQDQAEGQWTYYYSGGQIYQQGAYRADVRSGAWTICVQPGECSQEVFQSPNVPRRSGVTLESALPARPAAASDTSNPAAILESLDNGGVPDGTPSILNERWTD